ncbi:MAG TPA: threonine--tRNA ligase [Candidatus Atribacteria bacterium]|jgi:threonyl-tRNA synthetase|nr:threonine--tRNA ligase [Atribacterota bacterium]HOA99100.1 threonine--tRNA ligase [Candidatus Atribacteria bacterium]MDI9608506.1 threonine--tRNA ligase [Atribacterota bacterium]HOQ51634.1 threonine--tRNA ligase [Candidatus Atribacteria bacterium]HPT63491.1 threonine--tRNA ligase [Candidatus Atribacteria bacterium]
MNVKSKEAIAAVTEDGRLVDIGEEEKVKNYLSFADEAGREIYWHSTSHIMAQAVKRLFPEAKLAIGPAIEEGFYYDFDIPRPLTDEDLEEIEKEMRKIIQEDLPFRRKEVSKEEAQKIFAERGETYKVEILEEIEESKVTLYEQGEFLDLCRGPHVPSTGYIKAFKLLSVSGAYWRGREDNPMLQRIYGISFDSEEKLQEFLKRREEAKRRDHRRLGRELDLFSLHEEGPGFPFFHPRGMVVINALLDLWRREHLKRGYQEVKTPMILERALWEQSGHWEHYRDNMYFTKIDDRDFAIKPMNCPGGILIFKSQLHSYRELPLRWAELGLVHRHELSGVLHGLMRVRCFTQDDAHIFMEPHQVKQEIIGVIELADYFYRLFDFTYEVELSTRPENSMGSDEMWDLATRSLEEALRELEVDYRVNPGEGAFYGPKIDFHLRDCLGRRWQCGTIQLDFAMPEKFDLYYIGEDGNRHRPVMLHRTVLGSIERFLGILIEQFAGAFPLWLAPVQVVILPIAERHIDYAREIKDVIFSEEIRVEINDENATLGAKIRKAEVEKVPYLAIIGDREMENRTLSIRKRKKGDIGSFTLDELLKNLKREIEEKVVD